MLTTKVLPQEQKYLPLFDKNITFTPDFHEYAINFLKQLKIDKERVKDQPELAASIDACMDNFIKWQNFFKGDHADVEFKTPIDELKYIIEINNALLAALHTILKAHEEGKLQKNADDLDYRENADKLCKKLGLAPNKLPPYLNKNVVEKLTAFFDKIIAEMSDGLMPKTCEELEEKSKIASAVYDRNKKSFSRVLQFGCDYHFPVLLDVVDQKNIKMVGINHGLKTHLYTAQSVQGYIERLEEILKEYDTYQNSYGLSEQSKKMFANWIAFAKTCIIEEDKKKLDDLWVKYQAALAVVNARNAAPPAAAPVPAAPSAPQIEDPMEVVTPVAENKVTPLIKTADEIAQDKIIDDYLAKHQAAFKGAYSLPDKTNPELDKQLSAFIRLSAHLKCLQIVELRKNMQEGIERIHRDFIGWNIGTVLMHQKDKKAVLSLNHKAKPLYQPIAELEAYAKNLLKGEHPTDKAYGQLTLDFANELAFTAHQFFDDKEKIKDKTAQRAFEVRFSKLLDSKKALMQEFKSPEAKMSKILDNIFKGLLLTLTVIGLPLYALITRKNPFALFYKHETEAKEIFNVIEKNQALLM